MDANTIKCEAGYTIRTLDRLDRMGRIIGHYSQVQDEYGVVHHVGDKRSCAAWIRAKLSR